LCRYTLVTRGVQNELACSFSPGGCSSGRDTGNVSGGALKLLKVGLYKLHAVLPTLAPVVSI
jgi:hypothetical protein